MYYIIYNTYIPANIYSKSSSRLTVVTRPRGRSIHTRLKTKRVLCIHYRDKPSWMVRVDNKRRGESFQYHTAFFYQRAKAKERYMTTTLALCIITFVL